MLFKKKLSKVIGEPAATVVDAAVAGELNKRTGGLFGKALKLVKKATRKG